MPTNKQRVSKSDFWKLNNWISLAGAVLVFTGLFAFLSLVAISFFSESNQPYLGIAAYLGAPAFIWLGLFLIVFGKWIEKRKQKRGQTPFNPVLDLNNPRHRRNIILFFVILFAFFLLSGFGSYRAFQVTESVQFCGTLCHSVMNPEYTTYLNSPHARVKCTACHIGPGATWFVRSKISGLYQVYATLTDIYPRPIPTPVENLRPARGTCEQCHWPEKFYGSVERIYKHFLSDKNNTEWTIRMLVHVGGANPAHGPVGGIHWHMVLANRIEYYPVDEKRQNIPWIRLTNRQTGRSIVFTAPGFQEEPAPSQVRVMDCIDCHSRPTHIFHSPNEALDIGLWLNRIDSSIPSIKAKAVETLVENADAPTKPRALLRISHDISENYEDYPDRDAIQQAVGVIQQIYAKNFFPIMNTNWKVRTDNLGHKVWSGCFRCHDGNHSDSSGATIVSECGVCHTIIAQGKEHSVVENVQGLEFNHPGGELPPGLSCSQCHTGAL